MMRRDDRIDDEIEFHIEQQTAKYVAMGMTPDAARREARLKFGGLEGVREGARDQLRFTAARDFARDVRLSLRSLRRAPGFAAATILTFGLGLGAAVAMFSVVNSVLLKPLPYPHADRIVRLYQLSQQGARNNVAGPNFGDWQAGTRSFADMALMQNAGKTPVAGLGEPKLLGLVRVSERFFPTFGMSPSQGRLFMPAEYRDEQSEAAVVSDRLARTLAADGPVLGRKLTSGGDAYTVIGVMPAGFDYPVGTDIWLPLDAARAVTRSRTAHNYSAVARLADGVALAEARRDISTVSRALKARHGEGTWMADAEAVPVLDAMTGGSRATLQILLAAALLLLVVATANVSNMLVARTAARRKEFGVQLALGASRGRLTRQLLAETFTVTSAGAVVGFLLARVLIAVFVAAGPAGVPRLRDIAVDWTSAAAAALAVIVVSTLLALLTAIGSRPGTLTAALGEDGRGAAGGRRQTRFREGLIVTEIALTLVLLAGGGLLGRSLLNVLAIDPGFRTDDALLADVTMTDGADDPAGERRAARQQLMLERLRALPGVESVGLINTFPIGGAWFANGQFVEMTRPDEFTDYDQIIALGAALKPRTGQASYRLVDGGYFRTMGIPLLRGRLIDEGDGPDRPQVAVISESLARQQWPGQDPLGRYLQFGNMDGDMRGIRIVGVVGDVREVTVEQAPPSIVYASYRQRPGQGATFALAVRGPKPSALNADVRRVLREIAPEAPVEIRSVPAALDQATGTRRFNAWLIGAFALAALALATIGVYGLVSFTVVQRTREMGIRLALGATPGGVVGLIVRRGAVLATVGSGLGLVAALYAGRLMNDLLFGVTGAEPAVLAVAVTALTLAVLVATWVPARRVLAESPAKTLRNG